MKNIFNHSYVKGAGVQFPGIRFQKAEPKEATKLLLTGCVSWHRAGGAGGLWEHRVHLCFLETIVKEGA